MISKCISDFLFRFLYIVPFVLENIDWKISANTLPIISFSLTIIFCRSTYLAHFHKYKAVVLLFAACCEVQRYKCYGDSFFR